jgi:hypothetical protein
MKKFNKAIFFIFSFSLTLFIFNISNDFKCICKNSISTTPSTTSNNNNNHMNMKNKSFNKNQSIFCIILTNQDNFETKAKAIYETWAKHCDSLRFKNYYP